MVDDQVCINYFAKVAEYLKDFCFGNIIRQIAYKEFQPVAPLDYDRQ